MGYLVGLLDVLGSAWNALGACLWALGASLGMLGGSLGRPWTCWSCSCDALGGRQGVLGVILGVLGRSLGVPVGSLAAPWATWWETWVPICYAHRCFSVSHCSLLVVSLGVLGTYLGAHEHESHVYCVFLRIWERLHSARCGSRGLLGRLLGRLGGRPGAPYGMHTDVSVFLIVLC